MEEKDNKYIDSEFGRIPSDWRYCTFKDVLNTFSSGATPYRAIPEYYKGDIRWISSGELDYNVIYDTIEHISDLAVKNTNLKIHEPGTFLMAITGLEAEGTRGRCAFVGAPSATNQSCLALNSTDKLRTDYLFWFYRQWGNYLAFKYCQGTKQQSYTAAIVKKLPICCPKDPKEQTAIATALSDTDALIAALDKKIAKKQQIKQGTIQQLLTGKKRLSGFSGEWVEKKICEVGKVITGSTPSRSNPDLWNGNFVWVSAQDLKSKYIVDSVEKITEDGKNTCRVLPPNSVLVTCIASIGLNALSKVACATNQQINSVVCNSDNEPEFLYYQINNNVENLKMIAGQTAVPIINKGQFENFTLMFPNAKSEQTAIAQILTDMDNEIAQLEKERDKYKELKAGMMQVLLTGKVRFV